MQNTVKERLKFFMQSKHIGQAAFEKAVGLSNGYVNNIRQSIQPDKIQKIALVYPELNTGWLLTGEGNMLKEVTPPVLDLNFDRLIEVAEINAAANRQNAESLSRMISLLEAEKKEKDTILKILEDTKNAPLAGRRNSAVK